MGDGGLISNIATTLQSISDQGNTTSNTIQFTNTTTSLTSTGNVVVTNNKFFKGDGGLISNIAGTRVILLIRVILHLIQWYSRTPMLR